MPQAQDAFRSEEDHWFATEKKFYRVVRSQPPALLAFSYVDRPELVDDFLKPPADAGTKGVARFRYPDRSGTDRVFDWALDGQEGKSVTLPESDLTVTLSRGDRVSDQQRPGSTQVLGDDPIPIAMFKIQSGKDEPVTHMALANLPMVPNVIPPADDVRESPAASAGVDPLHGDPDARPQDQRPLRPDRGPGRSRRGALLPRLRPGQGEARASFAPPGRSAKGKPIVAFGGNANMPMTITFQVDQYLPAAIEKSIYEPIVLPKGQMGNGIAACRAEMTVDGQTKEVWLSRSVEPRPARRRRPSRSATRSTRSSTTSTASRWASSSSSTTSTSASSPAPSRRPTSRARSA